MLTITDLDDNARYKAMYTRDKRYDGIFYTVVKTTGIYCRPSCPAPKPLQKNCLYFETVTEARTAGFRACKRCYPDRLEHDASRAILEMIEGGALNSGGLQSLANRAGVSDRHARRLVTARTGITPSQINQIKRLETAQFLLATTKVPITDIAFTADFSSIRQFNDAFKQHFSMTPTAMRKKHTHPKNITLSPAHLRLKLAYKRPLLWQPLKNALIAHAVPGIENVDLERQTLTRLLPTSHGHAKLILDLHEPVDFIQVAVDVPEISDLDEVVRSLKRALDLDANPQVIASSLARSPQLQTMVQERPGLRIAGSFNPFELLINTIIGQQVSVAGARTLTERLAKAYGTQHGDLWVFPTPQVLADANPQELYDRTKINPKKVATIQACAQLVTNGFNLRDIIQYPAAKERLLDIKGIGPWTVEYVALRGFGDADAFPADDLLVKRVLKVTNAKQAEARAEAWRPFRGYGVMHIWTEGAYA